MQGASVMVATAPPKMSGTQPCDFSEYLHLFDLSFLLFKMGMLIVPLPGVIQRSEGGSGLEVGKKRVEYIQAPLSMDSTGKNTRVGSHFLLQRIFPIHRLNPALLHCRQIHYCLSHQQSIY